MSIKFPNLKRFFSLFLAAVMMVSLLAVNAHAADRRKITDYGDAYGHWAYEALTWAVDNSVMVGTSEDRLNPDGYLTRAQMAAMIDRLFGTCKSADISRFTDVPRGSWHHDYIAQAVHMGTFAGYSNSRMGPDENITREQAMVVLARTVCLSSAGNSALARFLDRNQVGAWAADAVSAMVERGYVSGYRDGRLSPKGQITRAEMVQIMSNIFQSVHDSGEITGTYRDTVLVRGAASIKDAVFESDLILANGLGEKTLDLNNITVKGRLVVWGGSAVNISGKSTVASVVTPRNDGPVQVVFDAAATEVKRLVEEVGFTWALTEPTGEPFEIAPVRTLINAYQLLGGEGFARMLSLLAGTWQGTNAIKLTNKFQRKDKKTLDKGKKMCGKSLKTRLIFRGRAHEIHS